MLKGGPIGGKMEVPRPSLLAASSLVTRRVKARTSIPARVNAAGAPFNSVRRHFYGRRHLSESRKSKVTAGFRYVPKPISVSCCWINGRPRSRRDRRR